jgi:hypothetical protein
VTLIETVPTTKVVLPSSVQGHENGKLPVELMRNFDGRGYLLTIVSYGMQALHLAAWAEQIDGFGGIDTETVGRYRTYARQEAMFRERYTLTVLAGRPSKIWNGQRWYQLPGTAMAAVPGTSNHGWGAADDVAEQNDADPEVDGMSDRQLIWMRDNAPSFGFGLESRLERWHWHWISGDVLPQRAVDVLLFCGIALPLPTEDTMRPPDTARVLDTRNTGQRLTAGTEVSVPVGATSQAFVNFTVTNTAGAGFLTAWKRGTPRPNTSNVNWSAGGQTVANTALVFPDPQGYITVAASVGSCDLIVDVQGVS